MPVPLPPCLPAATGYSITRSLREAPKTARAIQQALAVQPSSAAAVRFVWEALWTQERRRQVWPPPARRLLLPAQPPALLAAAAPTLCSPNLLTRLPCTLSAMSCL